ncbi:unnamed protein product [Mytilus coruscus]|uniref:Novel STAND NTPase 3 domain-containing protein n=1 Tax=Mytilus coruscus TaxID=42192 RepID=A0A6J8A2X4_MYTCO|nr:unnamed protein product [Mytilus coruscus]
MAQQERENFYRFSTLMMDHTKKSFTDLLELQLIKKHLSFEEFLNQNQHDIYHLCYNRYRCRCKCSSTYILPYSHVLNATQLDVLFDKHGPKLPSHQQSQKAEFCCSKAKTGITTEVLDVTLAKCLLTHFCADVFWDCCLTLANLSLEEFLNNKKHDIYHLVFGNNNICCQCTYGYSYPLEQLTQKNFQFLFSETQQRCSSCASSSTTSTICAVKASYGITVGNIDRIIANILLQIICPLRKAVDTLVKTRNRMYGHVAEAKISNREYKEHMLETEKSLIDIAIVCNKETETKQTLEDLRKRPLDETLLIMYQTALLKEIQEQKEISKTVQEIQEYLETSIGSIQQEFALLELSQTTKMKEISSAMNEICKQKTKETLRRTKKYEVLSRLTVAAVEVHLEEGVFVQTSAVPAILKSLKEEGHVLITGPTGSGKSRIALESLHQFSEQNSSYSMVNLANISEWQEVIDINTTCIVLCDDVFGNTNCIFNENIHMKIIDAMYTCIKCGHVKVVLTMGDNIKHKCRTLISKHRLFRDDDTLIDLKCDNFRMNQVEKRKCLLNYLEKNGIQETTNLDVENYSTLSCSSKDTIFFHSNTLDCIIENESNSIIDFPQTCFMFSSKRKFLKQGVSFFKHANQFLCDHITDMKEKGIKDASYLVDFTILTFILLNGDKINVEHLNLQQINNLALTDSFHLPTALFIYCKNDDQILQYLLGDICTTLTSYDESVISCKECLKTSFICFCRILNEKKACLAWSVIKLHNIRLGDLDSPDGFVQSGLVEVFRNISALELLSRVIDDSRSPLLEVDGFVVYLFDKEFRVENLYFLFKAFDRNIFTGLLWMDAACEIGNMELVKCFCEHFTFSSFDMVFTIMKACKNGNTELVHILVTYIAANDELIDHVWKLISIHSNADFIKAYFLTYGFGHFNMAVVMRWACKNCNMDFINCVLETVDHGLLDMDILMKLACDNGYVDLVLFLLESVNPKLMDLNPVVRFACERNNNDLLIFLLTICDQSLIHIEFIFAWACSKADVEFLKVLFDTIDNGLYKESSGLNSVLEWACQNGDLLFTKFLFEKVNKKYLDVSAAIKIAVDSKNKDLVIILLETCDKRNVDINSVMAWISSNEDIDYVEILFNTTSVSSLSKENVNKLTRLALENNREELIILIIDNAEVSNDHINSIIQWSWKNGNLTFIKLLLKKFNTASIDITSAMRETCYSRTCNLDIMKLLVTLCEIPPLDFKMAMTKACSLGHFALVRFLLDTFDCKIFDMKLVFNWTCSKGNYRDVVHLFKTFDHKLFDFESALNNACITGNGNVVVFLVEAKQLSFNSTIENACINGYFEIFEFMLERCDPNFFDMSSLFKTACHNGKLEFVELLIEKGYRPPWGDVKRIAQKTKNDDLISFIRKVSREKR